MSDSAMFIEQHHVEDDLVVLHYASGKNMSSTEIERSNILSIGCTILYHVCAENVGDRCNPGPKPLVDPCALGLFVVSWNYGLGAITWLWLSEIYPMEIRGPSSMQQHRSQISVVVPSVMPGASAVDNHQVIKLKRVSLPQAVCVLSTNTQPIQHNATNIHYYLWLLRMNHQYLSE